MPRLHRAPASLALLFILLAAITPLQAATPSVVASIKPIHSLVAGVMAGVAEPELLIGGGDSPHNFSLRPSDARKLNRAALIFWVGESLETPLTSLLTTVNGRVVELIAHPGIKRPPPRRAGLWEQPLADKDHQEEQAGDHGHADGNPHIWLSPANASLIVGRIEAELSALDPDNSGRYHANAVALQQQIKTLDTQIAARIADIRQHPYIVFHDAYQAFELHYGLNAIGSVTLHPERQPGARRIHQLRTKIRQLGARCIFSEPQFEPRLLRTLTAGTSIRGGLLDPLGAALKPGPEAYFELMSNLTAALVECLDQ